jgi:omega-6 fatty acid desaturase (delta-12 desaturase)
MKNLSWKEIIAKYQRPHRGWSVWQLVNTLVPYVALWYVMYLSLAISYWLTLGLAVIAAGLLVRIFIIFHDCGHQSFFRSQRVNRFWGFITGVLTFTPRDYWWHEHAQHHASAGNLDSRGIGDIWTMTVREYMKASRRTRFCYRLVRNPICLFLIGPAFMFIIGRRIPSFKAGWKKCRSTLITNLGIVVMAVLVSALIGWKAYLLIQLPVLIMAVSAGVWLFYVQHQFEGVYWERQPGWDYVTEALHGSSFYKLPKILQWFTGNIGFHHIHHLSPRIPNYFLERCYKENALFQKIKPITFLSSFKSLKFRLWDEQNRQLISFKELKSRLMSGLIKV